MRENILKAARDILKSEGADSISVRKIAGRIEYSPAIIYHYFKNKDEIIEILLEEEYIKIIKTIVTLSPTQKTLKESISQTIHNYINLAVEMNEFYINIMLNSSTPVLSHTAVLHNGASKERTAVSMLCQTLREIPALNKKSDQGIELSAQIVWSAVFGLAARLIVEKVDQAQKELLIDKETEFLLHALGLE